MKCVSFQAIFLPIALLVWLCASISSAQESELESIRATLTDYIEATSNGEPDRLRKAFHPDLNLYSIRDGRLSVWAGKDYIANVKKGQGSGRTGQILAIDFENNTAVAKVKIVPPGGATPFIDYFMLLKFDQKWTIVHKMYTRQNDQAAAQGDWLSNVVAPTAMEVAEVPAASSDKSKKVEAIFSDYNKLDSAGAVVCVLKNGKLVFQKAYGAANVEHEVPIDAKRTLFNIGSTSKQFTAFAVMLLESQGKLSLDDDIKDHIPELSGLKQAITLRHLLHHSSGIRSELSLLAMAGWAPGDVIRLRHIMHILSRQQELNFEPGSDYEYSNSGFTLLAEVVNRVSGQPFHAFCRENIFNPLGMNDSRFSEGMTGMRKRMAYSYARDGLGYFPRNPNDEYCGSTGLWTTSDDLAKWALNFESPKVGSKELIKQMETAGVLNDGSKTVFGMGLIVDKHRGLRHVQHGGGTSGYVSYVGRFPEQKLTVILLGNTSAISAKDVSLSVADVWLDETTKADETADAGAAGFSVSPKQLEQFTGRYWDRKGRSGQVTLVDERLVYSIDGGPSLNLRSIGEKRFEIEGVSVRVVIEFRPEADGKFSMHSIQEHRKPSEMVSYDPKEYSNEELRSFVGEYYCSELDTTYDVSLAEGQLKVNHSRFQNISLIPITNDYFRNDSWRFTTLAFDRNGEGEVVGFKANSMRNKNLCFTKRAQVATELQSDAKEQAETELSQAIDATAKQCLAEQHIPGLSIVVVKEGKTILKRGYGLANVDEEIAVDPDATLFRIGSISKALTFLTLTRLIDDGRVFRNDPVSKFVDSVKNPRGFEGVVTIDHLLTHTAGFDQIGVDRHIHQYQLGLEARKELRPDLFSFLANNNLRRVTEAGEMFRYDTYGTTLAGAIIEKVTGKPYAEAMKQEMFDVLGMSNTFVEASDAAMPQLAMGYGWVDGEYQPQEYEVYVTTPASSIDGTISDMGLLLEALTSDGSNSHGRLFSAEMNEVVMAPQFRIHPEFLGITHGLFESHTSDEAGTDIHLPTVGHGGSMRGFRSAMTIIPDRKIGVFITANRAPEAGGGEVNFMPLLKLVVDTISDAPKRLEYPIPKNVTLSLDEYVGNYYYGTFCHDLTRRDLEKGAWRRRRAREVVKTKDGLRIGEQEYVAREKDIFVQKDGQRMVAFGRDAQGAVSNFVYSTSPDTFERESTRFPYPQIQSLAQSVAEVFSAEGIEMAAEFYRQHENEENYYVSEDELNRLGYQLLQLNQNEAAVKVFQWNVERFPSSWNAFDSLGEAYAKIGNDRQSILNYEKSVELNPKNEAGKERIKQLRTKLGKSK